MSDECVQLLEFKKLLRDVAIEANSSENEEKNCLTRNIKESYSLTFEEMYPEVLMTLWTYLQERCPHCFQQPVLRSVTKTVVEECHNAKGCNFKWTNDQEENITKALYDLSKLQKFAISCMEKFLIGLSDNTQSENLKSYAKEGSLCGDGKCICNEESKTIPWSIAGHIKNKTRKMEDRHVCLGNFSDLYQLKRSYCFYGVFDGHSGSLAASYSTCHLPYLLAERLQNIKLCFDPGHSTYREVFESAFLETDKNFAQKRIPSGSTAVCALLSYDGIPHLHVAWVGDSKALLVSPTVSFQLVKPHKPDLPDERKRIEDSDCGSVMFIQGQWRVNGILNVSRSIGDFAVNAVIAEPDMVDLELSEAHDFLVLGTDGFWDHISETTIIETIYKALCDVNNKIENIPKALIELAKQGVSQDNITVVIVFLKQRFKIVENYKSSSKTV